MENRSHALVTGLFVVLLTAALVVILAWFRDERGDTVSYTVVSRTGVSGLNVKAGVKLRGVPVGKVASIGFDPADARQILITLDVDRDAPVTSTMKARLGYQGITGLAFVELIDDTTVAGKPRDPSQPIELQASLLDQLAAGGPRLLANANEATQRLSQVLGDENQRQLSRALGQMAEASAQVAQLAKELRPAAAALQPLALQAGREMQRADALLANADRTLQRFDGLAAESTLLAQDLRQRTQILDRLGTAAAQLQTTTQRLETAFVGPDRPRAQPLVDRLADSADSVQRAAARLGSLAEQPQGLLFGRPPARPGPGEAGFNEGGR
ncbi:MlaD family protein [Pelomonas sp. KK5]|uniref:MlaD family protein n=1 Tax=Pelomonas sp. KK5 TaxID=1855730 RepID=UPI00097BB229|nr:MlaD family protein [Pelomonas sp. KK5]